MAVPKKKATGVVNTKINTKWFLDLLKSQKMSIREYARQVQHDYSPMHRMFRGRRHFYLHDVDELHQITGASKEDILRNAGLELEGGVEHRVRLVGTIDKKRRIHLIKAGRNARTVEAPTGAPGGLIAYRYQTGGEIADLEGAVIYCKPLGGLAPEMVNRWCVVQTRGGDELVRIMRRGSRSGKYSLWLEGEETESDVLIDAAALIDWLKY